MTPRIEPPRSSRRAFLLSAAGSLVGLSALGRGGLLGLSQTRAASGPTLETRVVDLRGGPRLLAAETPPRFDLVGLHWRGGGTVSFRTRNLKGGWSPWTQVADGHLPDRTSEEAGRREGWRLGAPVWSGAADGIEYRLDGPVEKLLAHFVSSPASPLARLRRPALAGQPTILARSEWGASESIVREARAYAEQLELAILHHTAGKRPTSPAQSAAVLRAIQLYHVEANGWNDIGYNFLVDPFGQIFEGRGGGIEQNVIGAHALGYNTGSVGIALLGNFERQQLSDAERQALAELLSWRLDLAHLDPLTPASLGGLLLGPAASVVGHGDVNSTACPGRNVSAALGEIAASSAALGLPKLYAPAVEGSLGGPIRFSARLSEDRPWTVSISDAAGNLLVQGSGSGSSIDWTWQGAPPESGPFSWQIEAGADVLPASGQLRSTDPSIAPMPARPAGLPRRIPAWAWQMHAWQSLPPRQRGPRPAKAPRRLPSWYWRWRKWRIAVEQWAPGS